MFFLMLTVLIGCEDVIEITVPKDRTRLSIDALLRLEDNTETMFEIVIKATETSSFFENIGSANLDAISLRNEATSESVDLFESITDSGIYSAEWEVDNLIEGDLLLIIEYKNEIYEARATYVPTVPIDLLIQGDGTLFSGDETEVKISYTDEPDRVDYYLFDFDFDEYLVSEDTFYRGQSFEFSYFYDEGLKTGQELKISILGIDQSFFNYMNQLIVQSGGDQGPFQTPSATVKGNIVNTSDANNFALGYFAVCQTYTNSIEIE